MLRFLSGIVVACVVLLSGCGGSDADNTVPRRAPRGRVVEPQVIEQAQPDLTDEEAEVLWATPGVVRVIVRVAVSRDGVASNARVVSAEPKDLPVAQAFAQAVVRSLPKWKFRPAMRDGQPVDAEMNLTMEAEGGSETPPAP
jgi:hypothetical protein